MVLNAKMRRTGICGAMETLLIDREFAASAAVITALLDAGCEVRGDAAVRAIDGRVKAAEDEDWDTEYLDSILSARVVDGLSEALRSEERRVGKECVRTG